MTREILIEAWKLRYPQMDAEKEVDALHGFLAAAGLVIVPREPTEAPETLAALKEVTEVLVDWLPRLRGLRADEATARAFVSDRIAMAKAAIAKAEGKQ